MRRVVANRRQKDLPLVLNKVEYDGSNPIGMVEDKTNTLSSNLGTDRPLHGGKCIIGNNNATIDISTTDDLYTLDEYKVVIYCERIHGGSNRFLYSLRSGPNDLFQINSAIEGNFGMQFRDSSGVLANLSPSVAGFTSKYIRIEAALTNIQLTGLPNMTLTVNIYGVGTDDFVSSTVQYAKGVSFSASNITLLGFQSDGTFFPRWDKKLWGISEYRDGALYNFHKCDSLSTTTLYDSSGNNNHGTIINYYNGFWG